MRFPRLLNVAHDAQRHLHSAPRLAVLVLPLLFGCASDGPPPFVRDDVLIHVRLVERVNYKPSTHAYGLTRCANNLCVIELLREHYPFCLNHEIRHVFEGDWHAGRETLEGC